MHRYADHRLARPERGWWWIIDDEYLIASAPYAGYREIARYPMHRTLTQEDEAIVVLHREP